MSSDTIQISVRVSARVNERADRLREFIADENGGGSSRADVFRAALILGIRELEKKQAKQLQPVDIRERETVPALPVENDE